MSTALLPSEAAAIYDLRRALANWPRSLALRVEGPAGVVTPGGGLEMLRGAALVVTKDGREVARVAIGGQEQAT